MKLSPKLFLLSIFTIFLISGLLTGRATAKAGQIFFASYNATRLEGISESNDSGYPVPSVFNPDTISQQGELNNSKQRSILIITVDDIKAKSARLDSVWMILYVPSSPEITLIPVYPRISFRGKNIVADTDDDLQSIFKMESGGILDPMFLAHLTEDGFTWSKHIVLDRSTIKQIDHFVANPQIDYPVDSQHGELSSITPKTELTPTERIISQAKTAQNICIHYTDLRLSPENVLRYFPRLVDRIETDISAQEAAYEIWTFAGAMAGFRCVFPSFSAMHTVNN